MRQQEDDLVTLLRKAGFDHIQVSAIDLIVRRVDEQGEPVEIGLSLARVDDRPRLQPGPAPRLLARLRRLLGGSPRAAACAASASSAAR